MLKKQTEEYLDKKKVSFFLTMNLLALEAAEKTRMRI